jgi:hypothetical protein
MKEKGIVKKVTLSKRSRKRLVRKRKGRLVKKIPNIGVAARGSIRSKEERMIED